MEHLDAEKLLFTNNEGKKEQLQDIIDDGLDGEYDERIPNLVQLLKDGEPNHKLMACVMLVSWGNSEGFGSLIKWVSNPDAVPWKKQTEVYDRIYGADSAFELLADALKTSYYNEANNALEKNQLSVSRAMLKLNHKCFFGRTLALAISFKKNINEILTNDVALAIEKSIAALKVNQKTEFGLAFQTASLLLALTPFDDSLAAKYSNELIDMFPDRPRVLRELVNALVDGKGEETLKVLSRLKNIGIPEVELEVENALSRRSEC